MVKVYRSEKGRELVLRSYDRLLGMWGVPVEQRDVQTRYGMTHVNVAGDPANPPLLLFHGVGDNSALMWLYNAKALAQRFRLYAVDTMGGPGKSVPNGSYDKQFDQLTWIDDVTRELGLERFCVAGTSNGAWLAQLAAARRPGKVLRAVCMAGGLGVGEPKFMWRMMKVFLPEALFPTPGNTKRLIRKLCGTNSAAFEENPALMEHWGYLLKYFNNMAMGFHRIIPLQPAEVDALRERALFLIGGRDILSYGTQSIALLEQHRIAHKVVADAGHGINHERAELINGELLRHLST